MAFQINENIPLLAQVSRPTQELSQGFAQGENIMQAPIRNQLLQQQAQQGQQNIAIQQAKIAQAEDDRILGSIAQGAQEVLPDLEAGDFQGALNTLYARQERLRREGKDTSDTDTAIQAIESKDAEAINRIKRQGQTAIDVATSRGVIKPVTRGKKAPFQQGSGDMSGFVFDPNTGAYSIDPKLKQTLEMKAQKAADKGKPLTFKDKQGLNKDVTGIIKKTVEVKRSAEELNDLKTLGSAAAKLGAVFKFMKALDPTSVVRETEQGQVYAASGAASQLAGSINSMLGSGKLTDAGFEDLVVTAQTIANSNIESVSGEIDSLLDSFGESIPEDFKGKIRSRVPGGFDIETSDTVDQMSDDDLFK